MMKPFTHYYFFILLFVFAMADFCVAELIVTEIMYNPDSPDSEWEWVEIYNRSSETANLAAYVFDDDDGEPVTVLNIGAGLILPNNVGYLFNSADLTVPEFQNAWGVVNGIGVNGWPNLANGGDRIGLWESLASYNNRDFSTALIDLTFEDNINGWPNDDNAASIFLTDLLADNSVGANWALSERLGQVTPLGLVNRSFAAAGNSGKDFASVRPIEDPNILAERLLDFGIIEPNLSRILELEVFNAGSQNLLSINAGTNFSGPAAGLFELLNSLPIIIGPGESAILQIQFDPSGIVGLHQAVLNIESNDSSDPVFEVELRGIAAPSLRQGDIVINEIDFADAKKDEDSFVELKNVSDKTIFLLGLEIVAVQGNNGPPGEVLDVYQLGTNFLAPGAYWVLATDTDSSSLSLGVIDEEMNSINQLQNGPDGLAVRVVENGAIIDAVSWRGTVYDEFPNIEGAGHLPGSSDFADIPPDNDRVDGLSLQRIPDGNDTADNRVDFFRAIPTPGRKNRGAFDVNSWILY